MGYFANGLPNCRCLLFLNTMFFSFIWRLFIYQNTELKNSLSKTINPVHSRISVLYIFFICGTLSGNWVVRIPELQLQYALSKAVLGLILTGGPIGAILIMPFTGWLINVFGSKKMTMAGTLLFHLFLPFIFLMPNIFVLWLFLVLIGISTTIMDVSMNSQGIEVERKLKTSTMSSFHAFFSIGNVFGALIGGLFISLGYSPEIHFFLVSIFFLPFSLFAFKFLRNDHFLDSQNHFKEQKRKTFQLPPKEMWLIGLIAFIAVIGEMMVGDWGSIYIILHTNVATYIAAFGYAIFALFMTLGRLSGDKLSNHFPNDKIVQVFAIIGFLGIILVIMTDYLPVILFGFALLGIGISVLIPILFKEAGNRSEHEIGSGIAGIALFAYAAGIVEPFFIGQVASYFSLQVAFFIVAIAILLIVFMSSTLKLKKGSITS